MSKKSKKAGAGYMPAPEVAAVAREAIRTIDDHAELQEVGILYVFSRKAMTERGTKVPFIVSKLSGKGAFFAGPNAPENEWTEPEAKFLVTVFRDAWFLMSADMQSAMVDSALCRCHVESLESGGKRLSLERPDIEEFSAVVTRHGQNWLPSSLMGQAMTGQPELTVSEHSNPLPGPENPNKKKPKGEIHPNDYNEGRLGGQPGVGA